MTVRCIHLNSLDPYFNLAAEEHLLKKYEEDIFMIWRSESSIVVGKHQNALAEINHKFIRENNICVARRISGGGTVFHDPGNLNFTFIKNVDKLDEVNFQIFTRPIVSVLKELGLNAYSTGRNDLLIAGKKVSGNAEHIYKKRVLHHGTLLFSSQLKKLRGALKVDLSRFEHKAVQSNRSEVGNIVDFLQQKMSIEEFSNYIFQNISKQYENHTFLKLSSEDRKEIEKLRDEKYSQWHWIYGYSPKYKYRNKFVVSSGEIDFTLQVEKGKIISSNWSGEISETLAMHLNEKLFQKNHDIEIISPLIYSLEKELGNENISVKQLLEVIV